MSICKVFFFCCIFSKHAVTLTKHSDLIVCLSVCCMSKCVVSHRQCPQRRGLQLKSQVPPSILECRCGLWAFLRRVLAARKLENARQQSFTLHSWSICIGVMEETSSCHSWLVVIYGIFCKTLLSRCHL